VWLQQGTKRLAAKGKMCQGAPPDWAGCSRFRCFSSTLGASGAFDYMDSNMAAGQAGDWCMEIGREPAPDARREEFDVVWRGLRVQMARLVAAMGIGRHQIEDVLQDVYLSVWRKPPEIAGHDELRRWIYRVLVNRCRQEQRRGASWRRVWLKVVSQWQPAPEKTTVSAATEAEEDRRLIREALNAMNPREREVLVMHYFAGLDSREIGRILDVPDSTVRSRLRAGRRCLAAALRRQGVWNHE
jgi:RNA polymerase sigma-70 factor (ECF subfamily)